MKRFALFLAALFSSSSPCFAEKIVEWRLEQKHYLSGDHVIYVTPISVRIINKSIGYQVVSKAPQWRVSVFRDDDKVIRDVTRPEFYENQEYHPINEGIATSRMRKIGSQSLWRTKVDVFRYSEDEKWVGHLPGVPKSANDLILAYYKLYPVDGFIMKYTTNGENAQEKNASFLSSEYQGRLTVLETLRISEVPYSAADFKVPVGYKKILATEQIMTSSNRRKEADTIFEELGLGEKLGNKKAK